MIIMRHLSVLLLFCTLLLPKVHGQAFFGPGKAISDYDNRYQVDSFPVAVSGLPQVIDAAFGLSKVCFSIAHTRVSDLKVELLSPDGTSIWLTNRNGRDDGENYVNTCFKANGFSGYVHQAQAPFVGEYIPDGRISFINNNQNPNGTWYLLVQDLRKGASGNLNFVSIEFVKDPTPDATRINCSVENATACACPDGSDNCELLPDLIILPKLTEQQVKEYAWNDPYYPGQLRFATSIGNIGDGPMEAFGNNAWFCGHHSVKDSSVTCPDGGRPRQEILQRIYNKKGDRLTWTDRLAGTNYYEDKPGHNHYHIDDWVEFRLMQKKTNRKGKTVGSRLVAKGRKVSYCLFDSGICQSKDGLCTWEGVVYGDKNLINYGLGNYVDCNQPANGQGISVGGYDTYGLMFEGQHITLPKGLKSGEYLLEIEIDPTGIYKEKNKSNNTFSMPVMITQQETH